MTKIIIGLLAFILGFAIGGARVLRQVQHGRVVAAGRIYFCKDTGPKV